MSVYAVMCEIEGLGFAAAVSACDEEMARNIFIDTVPRRSWAAKMPRDIAKGDRFTIRPIRSFR